MVNSKNREVIIKKLVPVAFTIVFLTGSLSLDAVFAQNTPEKPSLEVLQEALIKSENNPASPKLRFEYAELLRKAGKDQQAFKEYLAVTDIDASYYVAYHMIAQHCKDDKILKEATRRLTHLKETKPKELMLRVALSELLEAQGDYYHASRALVDIVPERHTGKI